MADLIETFYRNAQLSDAAYADLAVGMSQDLYIQALRDRGFSALQATEFASRYSVLSTFSNSATGFSATLFQVNGTNEKILAIRGTDDWRDLLITDVLQIGLLGLANQYTDLKTFYLQLTVEGKLLSTDALTVTGHSLGGYLAQAFTVDHPLTVSHAYTYNAPGFGGLLINPFSALGIAGAPVQTPLITNVIAQGQSFVASTGRQLGVPEHVFIETSLNPLTNHGVRSLSDSLALYALFAKVDPNVSVSDVTNILNAASSVVANSLESGLDALRQILQGPTVSTTPIDNYEAYYTNLIALRDNLPTVSSYRVDSLVTQSSSTVFSQAKALTADGLAYRYALQELNPFALVGVDYGVHNPVGANGGPLDLYNTQTGHGTMTALYLSDRAELLARKNEVNVNDGGLIAGLSSDTRFLDIRTGFEFGSTLTAANDVIFGDDRVGDAISGRGGDDHLYGGDGADTIEGHDGSDYIEGNAGNDLLLSGGAGNDIILGQQGNDTLDGEVKIGVASCNHI